MMRTATCWGLALFFAAAGVAHFVQTDAFAAIVPPLLPFPRFIVQVTGAMELAFAVGLVVPRWRAATGWLLSAFLLCVLPANIYMAVADIPLGGRALPGWALWVRVLLQFPLIALVLWACRSRQRRA